MNPQFQLIISTSSQPYRCIIWEKQACHNIVAAVINLRHCCWSYLQILKTRSRKAGVFLRSKKRPMFSASAFPGNQPVMDSIVGSRHSNPGTPVPDALPCQLPRHAARLLGHNIFCWDCLHRRDCRSAPASKLHYPYSTA